MPVRIADADDAVLRAVGSIVKSAGFCSESQEASGCEIDYEGDEYASHGNGCRHRLILELADALIAKEQVGMCQELKEVESVPYFS